MADIDILQAPAQAASEAELVGINAARDGVVRATGITDRVISQTDNSRRAIGGRHWFCAHRVAGNVNPGAAAVATVTAAIAARQNYIAPPAGADARSITWPPHNIGDRLIAVTRADCTIVCPGFAPARSALAVPSGWPADAALRLWWTEPVASASTTCPAQVVPERYDSTAVQNAFSSAAVNGTALTLTRNGGGTQTVTLPSGGGGGGLSTVATDATITGDGASGSPLSVARPLSPDAVTEADLAAAVRTKLNSAAVPDGSIAETKLNAALRARIDFAEQAGVETERFMDNAIWGVRVGDGTGLLRLETTLSGVNADGDFHVAVSARNVTMTSLHTPTSPFYFALRGQTTGRKINLILQRDAARDFPEQTVITLTANASDTAQGALRKIVIAGTITGYLLDDSPSTGAMFYMHVSPPESIASIAERATANTAAAAAAQAAADAAQATADAAGGGGTSAVVSNAAPDRSQPGNNSATDALSIRQVALAISNVDVDQNRFDPAVVLATGLRGQDKFLPAGEYWPQDAGITRVGTGMHLSRGEIDMLSDQGSAQTAPVSFAGASLGVDLTVAGNQTLTTFELDLDAMTVGNIRDAFLTLDNQGAGNNYKAIGIGFNLAEGSSQSLQQYITLSSGSFVQRLQMSPAIPDAFTAALVADKRLKGFFGIRAVGGANNPLDLVYGVSTQNGAFFVPVQTQRINLGAATGMFTRLTIGGFPLDATRRISSNRFWEMTASGIAHAVSDSSRNILQNLDARFHFYEHPLMREASHSREAVIYNSTGLERGVEEPNWGEVVTKINARDAGFRLYEISDIVTGFEAIQRTDILEYSTGIVFIIQGDLERFGKVFRIKGTHSATAAITQNMVVPVQDLFTARAADFEISGNDKNVAGRRGVHARAVKEPNGSRVQTRLTIATHTGNFFIRHISVFDI